MVLLCVLPLMVAGHTQGLITLPAGLIQKSPSDRMTQRVRNNNYKGAPLSLNKATVLCKLYIKLAITCTMHLLGCTLIGVLFYTWRRGIAYTEESVTVYSNLLVYFADAILIHS